MPNPSRTGLEIMTFLGSLVFPYFSNCVWKGRSPPKYIKHLGTFSHLGGSVLSRAKSEVLSLAPAILMRVHGAFEI